MQEKRGERICTDKLLAVSAETNIGLELQN